MKHFKYLTLLILIYLISPLKALAITDPLTFPNNRFGIHIVDPIDLTEASQLVNSNGGDWGYITLVITQNDRGTPKWQAIFDQLRRLHLVPIVRLATQLDGDNWKKPDENDINSWIDFLDRLNWVVKNRYVVIFNEPNQSKEWGGNLDPSGYANMLSKFSDQLKSKSPDFFILPAGLDASAPNGIETMDEVLFLQKMKDTIPNIFDKIDGWTSHSYPNPGFSGSPYALGRGTIRTYLWEKKILNSLGLNRSLPIFITETGWPHREGINFNYNFIPEIVSAQYLKTAFTSVWTDDDIVAITPFVLNYQSYPFDNFSWKKPDRETYYEEFNTIQQLSKVPGQPDQIVTINFDNNPVPSTLITDSDYTFEAQIKNTGQAIFAKENGFDVKLTFEAPLDIQNQIGWEVGDINSIDPGKIGSVKIRIHTPLSAGHLKVNIFLFHKNDIIATYKNTQVSLIEPPSLSFHVQTGLNDSSNADNFSLLIYDGNDNIVQKFPRLRVNKGHGEVVKLKNVVVGRPYRIVVQKPYYLPRQEKLIFNQKNNFVSFKPMLPLDLDLDGRFTWDDYWIMIFHPIFVLSLLF